MASLLALSNTVILANVAQQFVDIHGVPLLHVLGPLSACASTWRDVALPVMFEKVYVRSLGCMTALLALPKKRLQLVRDLTIVDPRRFRLAGIPASDVTALLWHCTSLRSLSLVCFDEDIRQGLQLLFERGPEVFAKLRNLSLLDVTGSDLDFLSSLPEIQELTLRYTQPHVCPCETKLLARITHLHISTKYMDHLIVLQRFPGLVELTLEVEPGDTVKSRKSVVWDWLPGLRNSELKRLYISQ